MFNVEEWWCVLKNNSATISWKDQRNLRKNFELAFLCDSCSVRYYQQFREFFCEVQTYFNFEVSYV